MRLALFFPSNAQQSHHFGIANCITISFYLQTDKRVALRLQSTATAKNDKVTFFLVTGEKKTLPFTSDKKVMKFKKKVISFCPSKQIERKREKDPITRSTPCAHCAADQNKVKSTLNDWRRKEIKKEVGCFGSGPAAEFLRGECCCC